MTSLDGINGRSIQRLLRGENDSKQSDEFQATCAEGLTRTNQLYQKKVLASTVSTVQCVHSVQIISFSRRQKKMNELTLFTHVNNFNSLLVLKLAVRILKFCTCRSGRELNYVQKCPRAQLHDEFFFCVLWFE